MAPLPLDTSCQAEYADGFILDETELNDVSPYNAGQNVFRAILDKEAEPKHGAMVRFSVFYKDNRYDVDWTSLPENARPLRFRNGFITLAPGGVASQGWSGVRFGYQYNDDSGKNIQEVQDL